MNEDKINKAIEPLLKLYEKIENDLLVKIASHFSINHEFLNSDYWRIKKLDEMGLFNQEVIEYLARYSKTTPAMVKKALEEIGYKTLNLDKLNRLFEDEVLKIDPNILVKNQTIQKIIDTAYNELSGRFIEMSKKIEQSTKDAYLDIVEEAYLKTSMGTHSYEEAIRESINDLSNRGLRTLTYTTMNENGDIVGVRNYDIEGTVRREVLTGARQLSNNINKEVVEELDWDYLYLSEHIRCRPQHFDWQGTIIKKEDLEKIAHYGEVDGLGGINCAHYFEPFFGDERGNDLKTLSKEECEKAYNLSQKQRYLERGVRKWKRKAEMFKASEDVELYSKAKDKVREWQLRTKDFTEKHDLRRDFTREYVSDNKESRLSSVVVTNKWLGNKTNDVTTAIQLKNGDVFNYRNQSYVVDNKRIKNEYTKQEIKFANFIASKTDKEVILNPTINYPEKVKTADLTIGKNYVDMKLVTGKSQQLIYHNVRNKMEQAHCFFFEASNSELKLKDLIKQVDNVFKRTDTNWVETIGIKKGNRFIILQNNTQKKQRH